MVKVGSVIAIFYSTENKRVCTSKLMLLRAILLSYLS